MELTRESVRTLLELQGVDSQMDALHARRSELPEQLELDRLTAELEMARKTNAARELGFGGVSREATKVETEVANLEQKIAHESARLYGGDVTSPKELTALQAELDSLRRRKSHVEDQLLDLMEGREQADKDLTESKALVATLEEQVAMALMARDDSSTHIESDLASLETQRKEIATRVPEEAFEIYEDIRPKREGVAVAELLGNTCRGCMVSLSPFAIDVIRRSDDPLVRCENCRRILIIS